MIRGTVLPGHPDGDAEFNRAWTTVYAVLLSSLNLQPNDGHCNCVACSMLEAVRRNCSSIEPGDKVPPSLEFFVTTQSEFGASVRIDN